MYLKKMYISFICNSPRLGILNISKQEILDKLHHVHIVTFAQWLKKNMHYWNTQKHGSISKLCGMGKAREKIVPTIYEIQEQANCAGVLLWGAGKIDWKRAWGSFMVNWKYSTSWLGWWLHGCIHLPKRMNYTLKIYAFHSINLTLKRPLFFDF